MDSTNASPKEYVCLLFIHLLCIRPRESWNCCHCLQILMFFDDLKTYATETGNLLLKLLPIIGNKNNACKKNNNIY